VVNKNLRWILNLNDSILKLSKVRIIERIKEDKMGKKVEKKSLTDSFFSATPDRS